jgi:hypothetical protein
LQITYQNGVLRAIPFALALLAAAALTGASAATNFIYALRRFEGDTANQWIWGAVAVAASLALLVAPSAFTTSIRERRYGNAVMAAVAAVLFGAFSLTAALGSATGVRLLASAQDTDVSGTRTRASAAYERATAALAALAPSRPVKEVETALNALLEADKRLAACSAWTESRTVREKCTNEIAPLRAELARATERASLEDEIRVASAKLEATKVSTTAANNADAKALVGYASVLGWTVDTEAVNKLLVVLATLTIEFGGGLALAVALSMRPEAVSTLSTAQSSTYPTQDLETPASAAENATVHVSTALSTDTISVPTPESRRAASVDEAAGRVLEAVQANGGRLSGSVRSLASVVNASKSTTANAVARLVTSRRLVRDGEDLVLMAA